VKKNRQRLKRKIKALAESAKYAKIREITGARGDERTQAKREKELATNAAEPL
jgi:hypothetical protein